jgi:hypothetical protein
MRLFARLLIVSLATGAGWNPGKAFDMNKLITLIAIAILTFSARAATIVELDDFTVASGQTNAYSTHLTYTQHITPFLTAPSRISQSELNTNNVVSGKRMWRGLWNSATIGGGAAAITNSAGPGRLEALYEITPPNQPGVDVSSVTFIFGTLSASATAFYVQCGNYTDETTRFYRNDSAMTSGATLTIPAASFSGSMTNISWLYVYMELPAGVHNLDRFYLTKN